MPHSNIPLALIPKEGALIEFPGLSSSAAGSAAEQLQNAINLNAKKIGSANPASQTRANEESQDLGTVVGVVLGAEATIEFVKNIAIGIQKWFIRSNQSRIRIWHPDGSFTDITNLESGDVGTIINAINR